MSPVTWPAYSDHHDIRDEFPGVKVKPSDASSFCTVADSASTMEQESSSGNPLFWWLFWSLESGY